MDRRTNALPTARQTDKRTASYRGALSHLKSKEAANGASAFKSAVARVDRFRGSLGKSVFALNLTVTMQKLPSLNLACRNSQCLIIVYPAVVSARSACL